MLTQYPALPNLLRGNADGRGSIIYNLRLRNTGREAEAEILGATSRFVFTIAFEFAPIYGFGIRVQFYLTLPVFS